MVVLVAQSHDKLLTPAGVAALLFVDPKTVARWAAAGKLTSIRTPGGHRRYLRSEVLAMVAGLHPGPHGHGALLEPDRRAAAAAVVAEAVALASEAAAVEAAARVVATAAAVSQAAVVASEAADKARLARAYAAQTAARSVAEEARRTALHVQDRAALAAARVRRAAELAATELTGGSDGDATSDAAHAATTMAATVRAAAAATDVLTAGAARAVMEASSAAAERMALRHVAAEEAFAREASDAADTRRQLAATAALSVARETSARAFGVATVASEAAAAVHDEHRRGRVIDTTQAVDPGIDGSRLGSGAYGGVGLTGFAAELSHDLRGPLTSIMANVELLELELLRDPDPRVTALLGSAVRASERMVRILDRHMSPGVAGGQLAPSEVDLAVVVGACLADAADHFGQVGAVVDVGELPVVRADPDAMYSLFENLLTNAVKFARPGVPAAVSVGARTSDDGWRISVRDNGVGLTGSGGRDMFTLFSRGSTDVTGHGIGLATVARIVAEHGGRVGFTSMEIGAEIWFELPTAHGALATPPNTSGGPAA